MFSFRKPKQLPPAVQWAVALPFLALAAYWWWTYSGLYRWLAEWQIARWGRYGLAATFLFTFLLPALPVVLVLRVVYRRSASDEASPASWADDAGESFGGWCRARSGRLGWLGSRGCERET